MKKRTDNVRRLPHVAADKPHPNQPDELFTSPALEVTPAELAEAAAYDNSAFDPGPQIPNSWPILAKPFYMSVVRHLRDLEKRVDLNRIDEFHALLWMVNRLGGDQRTISEDQQATRSSVSKWIAGETTPLPERRRGILESAFLALDHAIEAKEPVPLREFTGRRAVVPPAGTAERRDRPLYSRLEADDEDGENS